ncbi:hypothetical protein ACVWZB_004731 [Paenibacillus polymyxa]
MMEKGAAPSEFLEESYWKIKFYSENRGQKSLCKQKDIFISIHTRIIVENRNLTPFAKIKILKTIIAAMDAIGEAL